MAPKIHSNSTCCKCSPKFEACQHGGPIYCGNSKEFLKYSTLVEVRLYRYFCHQVLIILPFGRGLKSLIFRPLINGPELVLRIGLRMRRANEAGGAVRSAELNKPYGVRLLGPDRATLALAFELCGARGAAPDTAGSCLREDWAPVSREAKSQVFDDRFGLPAVHQPVAANELQLSFLARTGRSKDGDCA